MSSWICTYTGKRFDPFDPKEDQIVIEDIAHALSNICRYTGHCRTFYSVAEHSVNASDYVPEKWSKQALLHDASEAYLMDIARPIKQHPAMAQYRETEQLVQRAILRKFKEPEELDASVHEADNRLLISEAKLLLPNVNDWNWPVEPYPDFVVHGWSPQTAERMFLRTWDHLSCTISPFFTTCEG